VNVVEFDRCGSDAMRIALYKIEAISKAASGNSLALTE
jgi:hypothetical protein